MSSSGYTTPERPRIVIPLPNPNAPMVVRRGNQGAFGDNNTRGVPRSDLSAFVQALDRRFAVVAPLVTPPRSTGSESPAGGSPGSIAFPDLSDLPDIPEVGFTTPTRQSPQIRPRSPPPAPGRGITRSHSEAFGDDEKESDDGEWSIFLNTPSPKRSRPSGDE